MTILDNHGPHSKTPLLTKIIYSYVTITGTNKKNICTGHIMHMVKVNFLTGHEETDSLHFNLKFIFHCIFIKKTFSQKVYS